MAVCGLKPGMAAADIGAGTGLYTRLFATAVGTDGKGQMWMADAPVTVVACGFPRLAYPRMGGRYSSLDIDLAIALDHLTLAAVEDGLGTCWIGAFFEEQVKSLLAVPEDARVLAVMPLGYPASSGLIREIMVNDRKPETEIFSANGFGPR